MLEPINPPNKLKIFVLDIKFLSFLSRTTPKFYFFGDINV